MARRKPQAPAVVINNLEQADDLLREMAECSRKIESIKSAMNQVIDDAKSEAKELAATSQARLSELEESLAAYATYQKAELFKSRKSVTRVFGTFGFRKSTEIKPQTKNTWGGILDQLKSLGMNHAIRIKEEVNKETLQEWPDERLEKVGARRVVEDKFWVEVDQAALEDGARATR
ncbi:MAG: host-nuclease inhibitor Gam family protein [Halioglobus sp.]